MGMWHNLTAVSNDIDQYVNGEIIPAGVVQAALDAAGDDALSGGLEDMYSSAFEELEDMEELGELGELFQAAVHGNHDSALEFCYGNARVLTSAEVKDITVQLGQVDEESDEYVMVEMFLPFYAQAADQNLAVVASIS